jgi:hypothetical protein
MVSPHNQKSAGTAPHHNVPRNETAKSKRVITLGRRSVQILLTSVSPDGP